MIVKIQIKQKEILKYAIELGIDEDQLATLKKEEICKEMIRHLEIIGVMKSN